MNPDTVSRMYAGTPTLYWPWLWWQLIWIERWIKSLNPKGDDQIYLSVSPRGTIYVSFMSDRLRGIPEPFSCKTDVTFESLTWGYLPDYVWLNVLVVRKTNALNSAGVMRTPQNASALIAEP